MVKIEWSYKGQDTYRSYHKFNNLSESLEYLKRFIANGTETNYEDIDAIRVELNNSLWVAINKNKWSKEDYYIMCCDYDLGRFNTFHDVEVFIKNFYEDKTGEIV
jgi:hypothetical protein